MNRLVMFLATNAAVMVIFSIVTRVFGLDRYIGASNLSMIIFATVFGFAGSFISLLMSKKMAIRSMRVHLIDQPTNDTERWLQETVHRQARESGIGLPDVGIFDSPTPNAFATGWNKNKALVAVSTGLLQNMTREQVDAVLGHEVAHVYNGDMVTMGLIQGVLNTFVILLSRMLGSLISSLMSRGQGGSRFGIGYFIGNIVGNFVFGALAGIIAAWFSRQREYRADAGGAKLAGREHMIGALEALKRGTPAEMPAQLQAFGISGAGLAKLRSTHPPLDVRIARLREDASLS